jgi:hypothetical protein
MGIHITVSSSAGAEYDYRKKLSSGVNMPPFQGSKTFIGMLPPAGPKPLIISDVFPHQLLTALRYAGGYSYFATPWLNSKD